MKKSVLLSTVCFVAFGFAIAACAATKKTDTENVQHPELTDQEKYVSCAECHMEATPELHKEWYESAHGIAMVKCYQCHGTFETFRVTPSRQDCAVCHQANIANCTDDQDCWKQFEAHSFKAKK